jgi:hypothetical protein
MLFRLLSNATARQPQFNQRCLEMKLLLPEPMKLGIAAHDHDDLPTATRFVEPVCKTFDLFFTPTLSAPFRSRQRDPQTVLSFDSHREDMAILAASV